MRNGRGMILLQVSSGTTMKQYAGIDVSLEQSSVYVVDAAGRIVREATVASQPDALTAWLGRPHTPHRRASRKRSELLPVGFYAARVSRFMKAETLCRRNSYFALSSVVIQLSWMT